MDGMLSDEEIDAMFGDGSGQEQEQQPRVAEEHPQPQQAQIPFYPLPNGMGQGGQQPQQGGGEGWALKKMGGVPVWAWGLIVAGVGGAGYFYYRTRKTEKNASSSDDSGSSASEESYAPSLPADAGGSSNNWEPSRSRMADQLNRYFQRKGAADKVKVWHDADEAKSKGKLKHVSPLINIETNGNFKVDKDFQKFTRREGLNPVTHSDGSVGLYPTESKRGKEWERYIDALRDEGQKV